MDSPGSGSRPPAPAAPITPFIAGPSRAPRVTVAIPVYKGERYLADALEAVLAQTFTDREVIVVDDASPDATLEVARRYEARGVAVHRNERNLRQVGNSNRCVELARSEYLLITHHDDRLAPAFLERTVAALDAAPSAALAYTAFREIGPDGAPLEMGRPRPRPGSSVRRGRDFVLEVVSGRDMPVRFPGTLIRKSALESAAPFDPAFPACLDFDLWMRLAARHDVAFVDEVLLDYRRHPEQETARLGRAAQYWEHTRIRLASLGRLREADALTEQEDRSARRFLAAECVRVARKFASEAPEIARTHLDAARGLDPRALMSWNFVAARLRLAARWIGRRGNH